MLESLGSVPLAFALFSPLLDTHKMTRLKGGQFYLTCQAFLVSSSDSCLGGAVRGEGVKYSLAGPSSLFWEGRKRKRQEAAARHCWALWKPGASSALRACPVPTALAGHPGRLTASLNIRLVSCPSERNILPFPQEATLQMYVNNRIRFKSRCKDCFLPPSNHLSVELIISSHFRAEIWIS